YNVDTAGTPDSAGLALDTLLNDTTYAYGSLSPTPRNLHYFAGDMEVQAKYRFIESETYAISGTFLVRLPTGHQDSPNNLFDIPTGGAVPRTSRPSPRPRGSGCRRRRCSGL